MTRLPGGKWQTENQTKVQNQSPLSLFKPYACGGGQDHRALTSDLGNTEDKGWIRAVLLFLVPRRWSCKTEWTMSSMEQCSSHVWLLSHVYTGCFKASMQVLYPESLLFSLTKDIRIKLILYYQTLYTTEVANNTELKNALFFCFFFFNILTFLSSATQESTVQNNSLKLTRTVTWSIKGYTVSTKQTDLYSLRHVAKPLATRGKGRWGLTKWGWWGLQGFPSCFWIVFFLLN